MAANPPPPDDLDLTGRVAVVTGAAAGLGRAEAIGLARSGATVVVNDMPQALDNSDVLEEIRAAGSTAVAVPGDVSLRSTADEMVACAERLGGLHVVVNNAGITRDRMLFNMSDEDWDLVIAVHLRGHFLLTRNAATYWRARAKSEGTVYGRIINTSSEAGLIGPVGQANYGAAKAAITALTLTAARGLGRYGVRANAICPRARTAMTADVFGAAPDLEAGGGSAVPRTCRHPRSIPGRAGVGGRQRTGVHRLRADCHPGGRPHCGVPVPRRRRGLGSVGAERLDGRLLRGSGSGSDLRCHESDG